MNTKVTLTKDAPLTDEDGELLVGPWRAVTVIDGRTYEIVGAATRWGAKWALKRRVRKVLAGPIVEEMDV